MKIIIKQYTGTSRTLKLAIKDKNRLPMDISGGIIYLTIKNEIDSVDTVLDKIITTHVDDAAGLSEIEITPNETKDLKTKTCYFDIQFKDSTGRIDTIAYGEWRFYESVTTNSIV